jgi:hypothetical protein
MKSTEHHQNTGLCSKRCKNGPLAGENYKLDLPYFVLATQNLLNRRVLILCLRPSWIVLCLPSSSNTSFWVVKRTTSDEIPLILLFTAQEIIDFQQLIRRIPVADNVVEYAVTLVSKTRPDNPLSNEFVKSYLDWEQDQGFAEFNSSRKSALLSMVNSRLILRC